MEERVHITKGMGYHVGIRDTSPYLSSRRRKIQWREPRNIIPMIHTRLNLHMLKAQVVTLQLSKSRAFYFHLEALRFFSSFPESLSIDTSPSRTQAAMKTNTVGAFSILESSALTTGRFSNFPTLFN